MSYELEFEAPVRSLAAEVARLRRSEGNDERISVLESEIDAWLASRPRSNLKKREGGGQ